MKNPFKKFARRFSESDLWKKLSRYAKRAGIKTVYTAVLLFYAFKRKETPLWAKNIVLGTLGYFLAPFDALPDLTPLIGYTDDLGVLSFGLVTIAAYVNDEVRQTAKNKLHDWFGDYDESQLKEVDENL
ncbi:MAG: YkvA family protein [Saprospiraceae bacterium]|nr:YkvA family protein [Saprospiraceae bacterium]